MNSSYWPKSFSYEKCEKGNIKVVSYNVNSLNAAIGKGIEDYIQAENPDILFLQETKLNKDHPSFLKKSYPHIFYSHCKTKKGYSGVCMYSRIEPDKISEKDEEGRIIRVQFSKLVIYNVYAPNVGTGRMDFREEWQRTLLEKLKTEKRSVLLLGDLNVCHNPIDIHCDKPGVPCYTNMERDCFRELLKDGYTDLFRKMHPKDSGFSLYSYRAGCYPKKLGMRLDYFLFKPGKTMRKVVKKTPPEEVTPEEVTTKEVTTEEVTTEEVTTEEVTTEKFEEILIEIITKEIIKKEVHIDKFAKILLDELLQEVLTNMATCIVNEEKKVYTKEFAKMITVKVVDEMVKMKVLVDSPVKKPLIDKIKKCEVRGNVYGASDHLPIVLELDNYFFTSSKK